MVTTINGKLFALSLKQDDQGADYLSKPQLLYSAEHEVAIWDLVTQSSRSNNKEGEDDLDLDVFLAEDSGKVTHLSIQRREQTEESLSIKH